MARGLFKQLKTELKAIGLEITSEALADLLGLESVNSLKNKMCGSVPWKPAEMYRLMEIINQPLWKMPQYFPPHDVGAEIKEDLLEVPKVNVAEQLGTEIISLVRQIQEERSRIA